MGGDGDYYMKDTSISNSGLHEVSGTKIQSYATRGHSSLSRNGDGDCRHLSRSGYASDKDSDLSRRGTTLTTANQVIRNFLSISEYSREWRFTCVGL